MPNEQMKPSDYADAPRGRCPTCRSNAPHLHPAVQFEGEVHTCPDAFHLIPTNQNRPEYIALVHKERADRALKEPASHG